MAKKPGPKAGNITAASPSKNQHINVSVRKINNGYIVSHSKSGDGDYSSTEHFHPKPPKISVMGAEPPTMDRESRKASLIGKKI